MIELTDHPEGVLVAGPGSAGSAEGRRPRRAGGALKVAVTAPPEDGRANAALVEVLRDVLGVKRSQVELLSGADEPRQALLDPRRCQGRVWPSASLSALLGG